MQDPLPDSAMEALYGAKPDSSTPKKAPTRHRPRDYTSHHRKAKPFNDRSPSRAYLVVGLAALVVMALIFLVAK